MGAGQWELCYLPAWALSLEALHSVRQQGQKGRSTDECWAVASLLLRVWSGMKAGGAGTRGEQVTEAKACWSCLCVFKTLL